MEQKRFDVQKALIFPINLKGEILMQKRSEYEGPDWGAFGGKVEGGESPEEAVIREAQEELSITITAEDLVSKGCYDA